MAAGMEWGAVISVPGIVEVLDLHQVLSGRQHPHPQDFDDQPC